LVVFLEATVCESAKIFHVKHLYFEISMCGIMDPLTYLCTS